MSGNPYNDLKVFYHQEALENLAKGRPIAPVYIRLKPTNTCNHHCSYCTYGGGDASRKTALRDSVSRTDMIPREKMQEIVEDMVSIGVKAVTFSGGGEPLTYPYIRETAQNMLNKGIDIALISNGQLLTGEIADIFHKAKWVRISFDSPNAEEYAKLRGISSRAFFTVTENIHEFAKNKNKECVLGINYVVGRENYQRVYEAAELMYNLGADNIKFSPVIENTLHYHGCIKDSVIEQIHRAEENLGKGTFSVINNYESEWEDKNFSPQSFPVCYACRLVTVIAADQRIYFCQSKAYDSHSVVGDLHKQSFRDAWFSEDVQARLRTLDPMKDCQNYCVFEKRNQLIQAYFDVDMRHVNFI